MTLSKAATHEPHTAPWGIGSPIGMGVRDRQTDSPATPGREMACKINKKED